jgi:hypothetical protein
MVQLVGGAHVVFRAFAGDDHSSRALQTIGLVCGGAAPTSGKVPNVLHRFHARI